MGGLAKIIGKGIFRDDVHMRWILKGFFGGECRRLMQEQSSWCQNSVDLIHQFNEWESRLLLALLNAWNVFQKIKRRAVVEFTVAKGNLCSAQISLENSREFAPTSKINAMDFFGLEWIPWHWTTAQIQ